MYVSAWKMNGDCLSFYVGKALPGDKQANAYLSALKAWKFTQPEHIALFWQRTREKLKNSPFSDEEKENILLMAQTKLIYHVKGNRLNIWAGIKRKPGKVIAFINTLPTDPPQGECLFKTPFDKLISSPKAG